MKTVIIICGIHSLFFAIFHSIFWKKLNWISQLQKLDDMNNAIMQILNIRIVFIFLFHSFICFWFSEELLTTPLGNAILLFSSLSWIGRTIDQIIYIKLFDMKHFGTLFISSLFIIGSIIYLIPLIY